MDANTMTPVAWAKWWLAAYDRQTDRFTLPLDKLTDEQLKEMWFVSEWWLRVAPTLMNKVLHPKHKPELRNAIAYLTDLHERQKEAWSRQRNNDGYTTRKSDKVN